MLLFVRFARELKRRGATVVVLCQALLKDLLGTVDFIDHVVAEGEPLPEFDLHASMVSLPHLCRADFDAPTVQAPYLKAPADSRIKLGRIEKAKLSVGIYWAGMPGRPQDRQRSVSFARFMEFSGDPELLLFSLQGGVHQKDIQTFGAGGLVHDVGRGIFDFAEAATALSQLDLLISIDAPIAHLAAAMGLQDLGAVALDRRLALAARRHARALVSLGAAVPPAAAGRLGHGVRRRPTRARSAQAALLTSASTSSTSSSVSAMPVVYPAGIVASVSASACRVDHRTLANSERGNGRPRRAPTSQKPPSVAGPNTSSCRPNRAKARAMWRGRIAGMSLPTSTTRTGRQQTERPLHALAEIALPLAAHGRSVPGRVVENMVGRDEQPDRPASIARQGADLAVERLAIEAHRRDRPDRRRQPPLHASELRGAGEDHEVALHPYSRRMTVGRQAGKIERKAAEVAHRAQQPAVAFVALGRGDGLGVEG